MTMHALTAGEHTERDEVTAHRVRREAIDAGLSVSLIGYDTGRDVYAWDVFPRTDSILVGLTSIDDE